MRQFLAACLSLLFALSGAHACDHGQDISHANAAVAEAGHDCHKSSTEESGREAPDLSGACSPFCNGGAGCGAPGLPTAIADSSSPPLQPMQAPAAFAALAGQNAATDPPPPKA